MNPSIQIGARVTLCGSLFFDGRPQTGTVAHRDGDMVYVNRDNGMHWSHYHVTRMQPMERTHP